MSKHLGYIKTIQPLIVQNSLVELKGVFQVICQGFFRYSIKCLLLTLSCFDLFFYNLSNNRSKCFVLFFYNLG